LSIVKALVCIMETVCCVRQKQHVTQGTAYLNKDGPKMSLYSATNEEDKSQNSFVIRTNVTCVRTQL